MELVLLTDYRGFLRQHLRNYKSMDKQRIKEVFINKGYNVIEYTFEDIINNDLQLSDKFIIYTSSQNPLYKSYIDDVLYHLSKKNTLIPRYDIFKAHENKGFQELVKRESGIASLKFNYFGNLKGIENFRGNMLNFPLVLKKVQGAGSSNVYKITGNKDLTSKIKAINKPQTFVQHKILMYIKKYLLKSRYDSDFYGEDIFNGPILLQEYVEGLNDDWKVLVFGSKYYVLNRKVRDNDFRASGSGKLSFVEPPIAVLDYAKYIFEKLDVPFVSLDIGFDGRECNLIEFQGLHFGPYTIIKSPFYYSHQENKWIKVEGKSVLEEEYANSIIHYIKKYLFD